MSEKIKLIIMTKTWRITPGIRREHLYGIQYILAYNHCFVYLMSSWNTRFHHCCVNLGVQARRAGANRNACLHIWSVIFCWCDYNFNCVWNVIMFSLLSALQGFVFICSVEIQFLCKVRYGLHCAHALQYTQYYLLSLTHFGSASVRCTKETHPWSDWVLGGVLTKLVKSCFSPSLTIWENLPCFEDKSSIPT